MDKDTDEMAASILIFLEKLQERLCLEPSEDAGRFSDTDKVAAVGASLNESGLRFLRYIVKDQKR